MLQVNSKWSRHGEKDRDLNNQEFEKNDIGYDERDRCQRQISDG